MHFKNEMFSGFHDAIFAEVLNDLPSTDRILFIVNIYFWFIWLKSPPMVGLLCGEVFESFKINVSVLWFYSETDWAFFPLSLLPNGIAYMHI